MTLQKLYEQKKRVLDHIQALPENVDPEVNYNAHAVYGEILFEIRQIENPLRMVA